jgi:hypothetical protein
MDGFELIRMVGAAARLTRLTTSDSITETARKRVLEFVRFNRAQRRALSAGHPVPPPTSPRAAAARNKVCELLTCPWCVGFWWCALVGVVGVRFGRTAWWQLGTSVLAASYALGWLAEHETPPDVAYAGFDHNPQRKQ